MVHPGQKYYNGFFMEDYCNSKGKFFRLVKKEAFVLRKSIIYPLIPGHIPDGHFPDGHFPDGHFPDGHFPDGQYPDRTHPRLGHFPDGHFPDVFLGVEITLIYIPYYLLFD